MLKKMYSFVSVISLGMWVALILITCLTKTQQYTPNKYITVKNQDGA